MCGIVGAVARRDVSGILLEGLQRLEYRGYDSAGIAILRPDGVLERRRRLGKVRELALDLRAAPIQGMLGIAHTRWATHGAPSERNAHPQVSGEHLAVVHNGIIENHEALRAKLRDAGYEFESDTDTEVIPHLLDLELRSAGSLIEALRATVKQLDGAYAIGAIHRDYPDRIVAARQGSPLVVGIGFGEHFIASDVMALRPVTDRFIFLEEGDLVEVTRDDLSVWDVEDASVVRSSVRVEVGFDDIDKGAYRHHMQKEIHEQAQVVKRTLEGRVSAHQVLEPAFGLEAPAVFDRTRNVTIVACGTSYYAGCVGRYWIEDIAGIPCQVEIASEFRYRKVAVQPGSLFVTISQSGETADTLAALRLAREIGFESSLTLCNVPMSSLVRESDLSLMLQAGSEIGVASTKAFTAMLVDLLLLTIVLGRRHGLSAERERQLVGKLRGLSALVGTTLALDATIRRVAEKFVEKNHALFLGRGTQYPVAMEGALKLKEISYVHAEGYPAGELKHGPLALVDADMPVIAVAPNNDLVEKLQSNLEEVRARGGELIVFADQACGFTDGPGITVVNMPSVDEVLAPIIYTIPMQLLAYHAAVLKGTDVDQPRNLAKSVTVE